MMEWLQQRSLPFRILVYVVAVTLAFAIAAGMGAMGTLLFLRGDPGLPRAEQPQPPAKQQYTPRAQTQQYEGAAQPKEDASQQSEAAYVAKVGEIQANSVETFLDSHNRLLRYDTLTADDVEEMQANQDSLRGFVEQVGDLNPPRNYEEQYEAFNFAINELYESVQLAHSLGADLTVATQAEFDEYDRHVNEATANLQRSNEILGRDYKTIRGVQKVNSLS